jgi:hypothetical protein
VIGRDGYFQADHIKRQSELVESDASDVKARAESIQEEIIHSAVNAANGKCYQRH